MPGASWTYRACRYTRLRTTSQSVDRVCQPRQRKSARIKVRLTQPGPPTFGPFYSEAPFVTEVHYTFHGARDQWFAMANSILRELDRVKNEEVPALLKRIAKALDATHIRYDKRLLVICCFEPPHGGGNMTNPDTLREDIAYVRAATDRASTAPLPSVYLLWAAIGLCEFALVDF